MTRTLQSRMQAGARTQQGATGSSRQRAIGSETRNAPSEAQSRPSTPQNDARARPDAVTAGCGA